MTEYFVDTAFWIALIDTKDQYHQQAYDWSNRIEGRLITTQAVLLETANTFSRPAWRQPAIALIEHLSNRQDITIVPFTEASWRAGWQLFCQRPDKSWSLTDCISFEVMHDKALEVALTSDLHFEQAGFRALLVSGVR